MGVALVAALTAGFAQSGIQNSKHDLSSSTTSGGNSWSGTGEICVFCHTPHGSDTSASVPLWNKPLAGAGYTPSPAYQTYADLNTSSLDGTILSVGSVSVACLSCHDGQQAMDAMLNEPGSGTDTITNASETWTAGTGNVDTATGKMNSGITLLGTDLRNDHPVGVPYAGGLKAGANGSGYTDTANFKDADFKAAATGTANGATIWWVDTEGTPNNTRQKSDMQLYTRGSDPYVECASCHDPHNGGAGTQTFLRLADNSGSQVCLSCHVK